MGCLVAVAALTVLLVVWSLGVLLQVVTWVLMAALAVLLLVGVSGRLR